MVGCEIRRRLSLLVSRLYSRTFSSILAGCSVMRKFFWFGSSFVIAVSLGASTSSARAECGQLFQPACPPAPTLTVKPEKGTKLPNPRGMYRVEIQCKSHGTLPVETLDNLIRTNVSASLLLAISDQNAGTVPQADKAKVFVSVYNVGGTHSNRTSYINDTCNHRPFFVATREPLYVIAAASNISTRELGPFLATVQSALGIASAARPLFAGSLSPSGGVLSAIENTESHVGSFIASFNDGHSPVRAVPLYEGKTTIRADYADIFVNVTALRSIVGLNNSQFTVDLENMLDTMIKPTINSSMTVDELVANCLGAVNQLQNKNNLSSDDVAYSLAYVARNAGLPAQKIIQCLGKDYALAVANKSQDGWRLPQKFDEAAVRTVLPDNPVYPQPEFQSVKYPLIRLADEMAKFVGTNPTPTVDDFNKSLLHNFLSDMVEVRDLSGQICKSQTASTDAVTPSCGPDTFGKISAATLMADFIAAKFTRFGCLAPSSDSVAYLLAIQKSPQDSTKGYQLSDALSMHVWVDQRQMAYRLLITNEDDVISTAISANHSYCGDLIFKSVGDGSGGSGSGGGRSNGAAPGAHPN